MHTLSSSPVETSGRLYPLLSPPFTFAVFYRILIFLDLLLSYPEGSSPEFQLSKLPEGLGQVPPPRTLYFLKPCV